MFDLVATTAGPPLAAGDAASRRLSLTLIREALRRDPRELTHVLTQVLNLPRQELGDLNALLQRTSLSRVIATAHQVMHRLEVLTTLDDLMTERRPVPDSLERSVHEIAAAEPWLFGDEYALALSERGLTAVLRWHRSLLDNPTMIDDPGEAVTIEGGIARVDLLLARTIENATNSCERLVVELKRPGLDLSATETTQIKKYAFVNRRRRPLRRPGHPVGLPAHRFLHRRIRPEGLRPADRFIHNRDNIKVRVSTWDSLLRTRRHRLAFLDRELQLVARGGTALARLREVHSTICRRWAA